MQEPIHIAATRSTTTSGHVESMRRSRADSSMPEHPACRPNLPNHHSRAVRRATDPGDTPLFAPLRRAEARRGREIVGQSRARNVVRGLSLPSFLHFVAGHEPFHRVGERRRAISSHSKQACRDYACQAISHLRKATNETATCNHRQSSPPRVRLDSPRASPPPDGRARVSVRSGRKPLGRGRHRQSASRIPTSVLQALCQLPIPPTTDADARGPSMPPPRTGWKDSLGAREPTSERMPPQRRAAQQHPTPNEAHTERPWHPAPPHRARSDAVPPPTPGLRPP